jgi:hypothetical protein
MKRSAPSYSFTDAGVSVTATSIVLQAQSYSID